MQLSSYLSINPAPFFRRYKRVISVIMIIPMIVFLSGCHYFKIREKSASQASVQNHYDPDKYVILHHNGSAYHLSSLRFYNANQTIVGKAGTVDPKHTIYESITDPEDKHPRRFKKKYHKPTNEIHLYVKNYTENIDGTITVNEGDLEKLEIYDWAVGATVFSYVLIGIGGMANVMALVVIIILATKSSCPFVYVKDGKDYYLHGEIFSGAIYPSMEKDDYLPIILQNEQDTLSLKIANELLEVQNINSVQLLTVSHPANTSVLMGPKGTLHTIGKDYTEPSEYRKNEAHLQLNKEDQQYFFFDEEKDGISELKLSFKKPQKQKAKLVVKGKNSMWLDYMYGKFNESFGVYYNQFAKEQSRKPKSANIQWYEDQKIPLSVYVETKNGWHFVDYFDVVGPLVDRDMVMEIDLSMVEEDVVNIKLETGFRFWELDYVALDYTTNQNLNIQTTQASAVIDQDGNNVKAALSATDNNYLVQKKIGDFAQMYFALPAKVKDRKQTHFLHSRGYYQYIRDYKGMPDFVKLNGFKKKGSFNLFAKDEYKKLYENQELTTQVLNNGI